MKTERSEEDQLPHLGTFSKAAELSSFTAAAKSLGLTQAAVSQRIQVLEKTLDTPLFHRQGGRVLLTEAGQRLYDYAERILAMHREARQEITRQQKPPISGSLLLGASTIPGEYLLPTLLSIFHERFPRIQVKAEIGDSVKVIAQVERGQVSLGLVGRRIDNPHLEYRHLATDRMVLVVPSSHPWSRRKHVSFKQLCKQPLVLREAGSGLRHCLEKQLARLGKSLNDLQIALELGSNEAIKKAVLRGLGLAILSSYAVEKELLADQLVALKVTDLHCDREMFVVWDKRRVLSAPARAFRFFLETNPIPDPAP
jgi:LysR family transcriptional regulator, low CO2-responsive transcriptional regulator